MTSTPNTAAGGPGPRIREAGIEDLDELVRLEEAAFATDRLSRRSFRRFLLADTDHMLLAESGGRAVGYILMLRHRGTRLARLYSICVDAAARGQGVAERLIEAGERAVREAGCAYIRLEVRADNAGAIRLYRRLGYRQFGTVDDYYEDGETALRFEKRIRYYDGPRADLFVPYYAQTTPFTCGAAALLMAMRALDPGLAMDAREELRLWREATTIYMTSGHGGCGPHGLALAAWRRGFHCEIRLNDDRVLFQDGVRGEDKKRVLGIVHADYAGQVAAAGIPVAHQPLSLEEIRDCLARRVVPVVLISAWRLTQEKAPHWVVVSAIDDDYVYIHDPELKPDGTLSETDKENIPIDRAAFARMARFGQSALRAALLVSRPRRTRARRIPAAAQPPQ